MSVLGPRAIFAEQNWEKYPYVGQESVNSENKLFEHYLIARIDGTITLILQQYVSGPRGTFLGSAIGELLISRFYSVRLGYKYMGSRCPDADFRWAVVEEKLVLAQIWLVCCLGQLRRGSVSNPTDCEHAQCRPTHSGCFRLVILIISTRIAIGLQYITIVVRNSFHWAYPR